MTSDSATSRVRVAVVSFALVSVAMMLRMAGFKPSASIVVFACWLLLPFLIAHRMLPDTHASRARLVAAVVATLPSTLAYIALAFPLGRQSSTAGLAFLFFPLWQLILVGVCFTVAGFAERRSGRARRAP